jgi:pheromone shutdown protein TraB
VVTIFTGLKRGQTENIMGMDKKKIIFLVILVLGLGILVGPEACEYAGEKTDNAETGWDNWESQSETPPSDRVATYILYGILIVAGIILVCVIVFYGVVLFADILLLVIIGVLLLVAIWMALSHPAILVLVLLIVAVLFTIAACSGDRKGHH